MTSVGSVWFDVFLNPVPSYLVPSDSGLCSEFRGNGSGGLFGSIVPSCLNELKNVLSFSDSYTIFLLLVDFLN